MAKYFEATNADGTKAIIDDTYRYLYDSGTVLFATSTKDFGVSSCDSGFTGNNRYWDEIKFTSLNQWHVRTRGYKYFGNVISKENNILYGIRFKQASTSFKLWVRLFPSVIGASLVDSTQQSLLVEVFSEKDISISEALNYFEIVKIKNDILTMPYCNNGVQIFNSEGEEIWNSNCNMVSVLSVYKGTGGTWKSAFSTKNILIPAFGYKNTWNTRSDGNFGITFHAQKDAYRFDGTNVYNELLTINERKGYTNYGDTPSIWDTRDSGFCNSNDISGIIATS